MSVHTHTCARAHRVWKIHQKDFQEKAPRIASWVIFVFAPFCIPKFSLMNTFLFINKLCKIKLILFVVFFSLSPGYSGPGTRGLAPGQGTEGIPEEGSLRVGDRRWPLALVPSGSLRSVACSLGAASCGLSEQKEGPCGCGRRPSSVGHRAWGPVLCVSTAGLGSGSCLLDCVPVTLCRL